jgi:uncharacterized protein (TIGR02266 family)
MEKEMDLEERRDDPRISASVPARVEAGIREVGEARFRKASTRNISRIGAYLDTGHPLAAGVEVELRFDLPGVEKDVRTRGLIKHAEESSSPRKKAGLGVEFTEMPARSSDAIDRFVTMHLLMHPPRKE